MTMVRRCDNTACTNGPDGTVNVSNDPNPGGWFTGNVAPISGGQGDGGDYCSADCAGAGLTAIANAA